MTWTVGIFLILIGWLTVYYTGVVTVDLDANNVWEFSSVPEKFNGGTYGLSRLFSCYETN
jgi:hypothetical protein